MKKIIMMLVTMSMILSLVACGNSKETGSSETDIENNSTVANESTEKVSEQEIENNSTNTSDSKEDVENSNSSLELTVEADYENLPESQGFEFESNGDGTCTLKKIGSCSDTDIVIPEKSPAGDTVTMIAEYAFYGAEDINSIVIAGKTMELDTKAFQSCKAKKIVISGCDLQVGENAFSYCDDVNEVYISNSKLDMETYAFYDTGKDMGVEIINCTGVLDDKAFQSCGVGELIISGCTLELGENVFSYCEDLATITMDSSTLEIGTYAFYDSGDDTTVTFTNCGLNIDDKAFQSCGLITLNISGSDTVMGENSFSYCEDLTDVVIGANNIEIGTYSFYDCTSLVNVSIAADSEDDNLELVIDDEAFQSCSVQNVVIGRGKVEIGDNAFSYCEDLVSVEIKGALSDIGDYAFYDCPAALVISYNGGSYNKESIEDAK
ncbi:MAG: leucine-rich repeat protein [Lachnospiraceae bacterium]|nr:leucine-rich repeat protein [Lachnospiraceae bacterium]